MIIVKIWGGLGNQLFQYCFGRSLSLRLKAELKFDIKTINKSKNFTNREIGLTDFNVAINIASNSEIKKYKYFNRSILSRIERKTIQKIPIINSSYCVESHDLKRIYFSKLKNNCYYDGYWQSEYYFNSIRHIIEDEFVLLNKLNKAASITLKNIETTNSISIHVRRGDYLSINKNITRIAYCGEDYYNRSISQMKKKYSNITFFVFSDDINWAEEIFDGPNFKIVKNNSPSVDMLLMSRCKHNIIANSTFSWWGAWLNSSRDKTVIAPQMWYNSVSLNQSTTNLIPKEWNRI